MSPIEVKLISPDDMIREIETSAKLQRENKYAFQVGLKDLDFDVNQEAIEAQGLKLPFVNLQQVEQALSEHWIVPAKLIEYDGTEHNVIEFDPRPIGFSGFMDCVTHSLALTDLGLFEVGRYPAFSASSSGRIWQWFLHKCWASSREVAQVRDGYHWSSQEFIEQTYQALTGLRPES